MGSVPLMYQGSKYAPRPLVTIPGPPPLFDSAEIGTVNASTVAVTFDQNVSASNYATGVTIKVNGAATSITSATRQSNHAIVRYVIPVLWHGSGDVVTWEYNSAAGNIVAESGATPLGDVTAQSVTNNCEYAALLDLQADTLVLNDNDPISTWADQSGGGHDFTQTGDARPTKQTTGGYAVVVFDGIDDWLLGDNSSDNLLNATIFFVENLRIVNNGYVVFSKITNEDTGTGWDIGDFYNMFIQEDESNYYTASCLGGDLYTKRLTTFVKLSNEDFGIRFNGSDQGATLQKHGTVNTFATTTPMVIATTYSHNSGYEGMDLYAAMILSPAPNATNRAALEARLAARYGITL